MTLIVFPCLGIGQEKPSSEDCKKIVLRYLQRMETVDAPEEGEVYHLKYRTKTQFPKELGISSTETSTEIFSGKNQLALYDQKMLVFGDDDHILVVIPEHQKIYWNSSDPKIFDDVSAYKKSLKIQRALFDSAIEVSCEDKNGLMSIKVRPGHDFALKTKLVEQQITYSTREDRVVKVDNLYGKSSKIKKQSIAYEILDFNSPRKITAPITALFKDNELRPEYKGFQIIDNRQN